MLFLLSLRNLIFIAHRCSWSTTVRRWVCCLLTLALITFPKNSLLFVFSPLRSKAILAYYEQLMIKFRNFCKLLENLLGWFCLCLGIDLPLPGYRVNSAERLHGKLGIRTPVLNRTIAKQVKDILLVCSTNVLQTDGFPSFFFSSSMQVSLYGVCLGSSRTAAL